MAERVDCVVIGAGVVGLACARALACSGREVLVLERQGQIGTETSSRNSEVIHAGIYYDTGSLKAKLCVRGKAMLYGHCEAYGVPFQRCGKIIANHKPFAVGAHLISCDRARRGSKRFLRHGIRPDGWSCRRYPASVTSIAFTCRNGAKDFYAIRR